MTLATAGRITKMRSDEPVVWEMSLPLAASAKAFTGCMVAIDYTGYAGQADDVTSYRVMGVAQSDVDNSVGAATAGAKSVVVRRGTFAFNNGTGVDILTQADYGRDCFATDDNTVNRTDGGGLRPVAGRFVGLDADGQCWVEVGISQDKSFLDIPMVSGADQSTTGQYLFQKISTTKVVVNDTVGGDCVGVLMNKPVADAIAIVRVFGKTPVKGGATLAVGVLIKSSAAGKTDALTATSVTTGGTVVSASNVMGRVISTGALDSVHYIMLQPIPSTVPTTAV